MLSGRIQHFDDTGKLVGVSFFSDELWTRLQTSHDVPVLQTLQMSLDDSAAAVDAGD